MRPAQRWQPGAPAHVLNLTLLPLTGDDSLWLQNRLGEGRVVILSRGYGNCRIVDTHLARTWRVTYFNAQGHDHPRHARSRQRARSRLRGAAGSGDSAERLAEVLDGWRRNERFLRGQLPRRRARLPARAAGVQDLLVGLRSARAMRSGRSRRAPPFRALPRTGPARSARRRRAVHGHRRAADAGLDERHRRHRRAGCARARWSPVRAHRRDAHAGVPVLQRALRVAAVGFEADADAGRGAVGVLVTPWFMNLVWLPLVDQIRRAAGRRAAPRARSGSSSFDFIGAHEDGFGPSRPARCFRRCSSSPTRRPRWPPPRRCCGTARAPESRGGLAEASMPARRGFLLAARAAAARRPDRRADRSPAT